MITLRLFSDSDIPVLQKEYPNMPRRDICEMIAKRNSRAFNGQFFELLAINAENQAVGFVSLRGQTKSLVTAA